MLRALGIGWCVLLAAQTSWVLAANGHLYGAGAEAAVGSRTVYAYSDFDQDDDVDLDDFEVFCGCLAGPDVSYDPLPPGCTLSPDGNGFLAADLDTDGDVDIVDFISFQACFSGAGNPPDPACGPWPGNTEIILNGDSITVNGTCVTVDGTKATITCAGSYDITGTLNDGQIVVDTQDTGLVQLNLNGVDITNSANAPLYVLNAADAAIVLADQTTNYLTDPGTYVFEDPEDTEPNAALFSNDPLTISGPGTLVVQGNYNDAIASKDTLTISSGTINVTAVDDGIRGKDHLLIEDGTITVTAIAGDGLKADNSEEPGLGNITVQAGTVNLTCGGDGLAAENAVSITGGDFTILCAGGHTMTIPGDASAKGIKGAASVEIGAGTFELDTADDGIHSNAAVTIDDGTFTIASGDDAIHSDLGLEINGGTITITTCYEAIDGGTITITDGDFDLTSSDDTVTATGTVSIIGGEFAILSGGGHTVTIPSSASAKGIKGLLGVTIGGGTFDLDCADDGIHTNNDLAISGGNLTIATNSSTSASYGDGVHADDVVHITGGTIAVTTSYEGLEGRDVTIDNGTIHITSTDDGLNAAGGAGTNNYLRINGGYIVVNAGGDGIDVNGSITMTAGTVIVHGPTGDMNAAIDYDVSFNISGGFLVASGSAGMAQAPSPTSTQRSVKITYSSTKTAGTLVHIQTTSGGTDILTFAPSKSYRSVVFSAPTLLSGTSYDLYRGGSSTGAVTDGLYQGGTYTPGTKTNTFTTNSIVTNVNAP